MSKHHAFWPKRAQRSVCRVCGSHDTDPCHMTFDRIDVTAFGEREHRYVDGPLYVERHIGKKERKRRKAEARRERRMREWDWL